MSCIVTDQRGQVKLYIDTYLVQEQDILDGSDFFFDALPADIESIKVIDNTTYNGLTTSDKISDSEVDFNIESRGLFENREG
jgi:hypothetical protein